MLDINLLGRVFFRLNYLHNINNTFIFGASFSSEPQAFTLEGSSDTFDLQETRLNIHLGIFSFHMGWREKYNG